jgi:translocation and assembly module TamB
VAQVQLQKNLFNERLLVQLGSQVDLEGNRARQQRASDLLGDVSLEYLLNPDGSLRLRAFRRQQFEGVVEGQLVVSGTSLVYSREFNRFSEAFRSRPTPQLQSEPAKKEEKP